ncbi:MAG: metallophosphoesterase [Oscillospiraceae bacterium]|nr:metallophosphoesterase [Oscillospiraceae bacterium]
MILVTGDIHGFGTPDESARLSRKNKLCRELFASMDKEDYLVICGDFGLLWNGGASERWWLRWLEEKPYTTLFIDGNHENFAMLDALPAEEWHGGRIHRISDSILHLMRGELFEIEGRTFFTLGGAESHDKPYRIPGVSWWPEELPSEEELAHARETLDACGWQMDGILTHCLPTRLQREVFPGYSYPANALTDFLETLYDRADFSTWYAGHYHVSGKVTTDHRVHIIYQTLQLL